MEGIYFEIEIFGAIKIYLKRSSVAKLKTNLTEIIKAGDFYTSVLFCPYGKSSVTSFNIF